MLHKITVPGSSVFIMIHIICQRHFKHHTARQVYVTLSAYVTTGVGERFSRKVTHWSSCRCTSPPRCHYNCGEL